MTVSFVDRFSSVMPSGGDKTPPIVSALFHDSAAISVLSPNGLEANTYTIEVTYDETPSATGNWFTLKDRDGTSTRVPAANESMWYTELPAFSAFRIKSSANVLANRTFFFVKHHTI